MSDAPERADETTKRVQAVFDAAGAQGYLHARDIDGDAEFTYRGDASVVLASVFKIPIALEYARQAAAGRLDRAARQLITAADREGNGIGTDGCAYDVELSVRDTAFMMMSMSDNAATDALLRLVGKDNVRATLDELGFARTGVTSCRELFDEVFRELGLDPTGNLDAQTARVTVERLRALSVRDPERAVTSTSREITRLLAAIWRDEAGSAEACAEVREIMGRQVWPHRLSSGFEDGIRVSGKTGTMWGVRNEAGVVEYPDGKRYAVAVFVRTDAMGYRLPKVDAAIGLAAREAVDHLRG